MLRAARAQVRLRAPPGEGRGNRGGQGKAQRRAPSPRAPVHRGGGSQVQPLPGARSHGPPHRRQARHPLRRPQAQGRLLHQDHLFGVVQAGG